MFAVTLCSGSAGNATLIGGENGFVLVDAGLSLRRLHAALGQLSLPLERLRGVLVTHEHGDHVSGLGTLFRKTGLPVYAAAGTAAALRRSLPGLEVTSFRAGDCFRVEAMQITSFATPHDAADSVGYVVQHGDGRRAAVCTDLGYRPEAALDALCGADYLVLEANHDIDMLKYGPYPARLKRRILGERGHLSNDACAEAAYRCAGFGAKRITLAHLSEENNSLDVALGTVAHRLRDFAVTVDAAPRFTPGEVFCC